MIDVTDISNWLHGVSRDEIAQAQKGNVTLRSIIGLIEKNEGKPSWDQIFMKSSEVKTYLSLWELLAIHDGVLYRKWESEDGKHYKWLLVVPSGIRDEVLKQLHDSITAGHLGVKKTISRVKDRFFWVGITEYVKDWCSR